ncbi:hypothetical protein J4526_07625 [Desulfurococcaceae archaeon MEX13E-LK6-19]|nr:hypothetical protein J4526_07625 [Desulfurococcaceae archaeon MEX13E-LK6-19]
MYRFLPQYYSLLYITFTKWGRSLGKGLTTIISQEPLQDYFAKIFNGDELDNVIKLTREFLEKHVEQLREHNTRIYMLTAYEDNNKDNIKKEMLELVKNIIKNKKAEETSYLIDIILKIKSIKQGIDLDIVKTISCNRLVKPLSNKVKELLDVMSSYGLVLHLPKDEWYLLEELRYNEHYVILCILFDETFIRDLEKLAKSNHKVLQGILVRIGKTLGYDARHEYYLLKSPVGPRVDAAWCKDEKPVAVFEIELSDKRTGLVKALHNLSMAKKEGIIPCIIVRNDNRVYEAMSIIRDELKESIDEYIVLTVEELIKIYRLIFMLQNKGET